MNAKGLQNYNWMNDPSHEMGLFKLEGYGDYVELPYIGVSVRVAPSPGCTSNLPSGSVSATQGHQVIATCHSSQGGTPSPQTLIEYTYTPSPNDVIDSSFVDGYSMPVRLEYKT